MSCEMLRIFASVIIDVFWLVVLAISWMNRAVRASHAISTCHFPFVRLPKRSSPPHRASAGGNVRLKALQSSGDARTILRVRDVPLLATTHRCVHHPSPPSLRSPVLLTGRFFYFHLETWRGRNIWYVFGSGESDSEVKNTKKYHLGGPPMPWMSILGDFWL